MSRNAKHFVWCDWTDPVDGYPCMEYEDAPTPERALERATRRGFLTGAEGDRCPKHAEVEALVPPLTSQGAEQ